MINEINDYLTKNKKQFFSMMNSHWGKNDDDTKKLKFLWNKALEANGVNNKIHAFEELKGAMKPFIKSERLAINEKILEDNNIDKFGDPSDQMTLEMDRMFDALSNFPKVNKNEDLNIHEAISQNYDNEQMKTLAEQYGYDWNDKAERTEFASIVGDADQRKQLDKIWKEGGDALYTDLVAPIAKDYARKNYDKIDSESDLVGPAAADATVNTLMALPPFKFRGVPVANDIWAAPIARQGFNMAINDKEALPALQDATNEALTNIATPYALRTGYRWGGRVKNQFIGNRAKNTAQTKINEMADKAYEIEKKLEEGVPFAEVDYLRIPTGRPVQMPNGVMKPTKMSKEFDKIKYYKIDKNGNKVEINEADYLNAPERLTTQDLKLYGKYKPVLRTETKSNGVQQVSADNKYTSPGNTELSEGIAKANESGRDPVDVLDPGDFETLFGVPPKETRWNWATRGFNNAPLTDAAKSYITNQQGRSKYAGRLAAGVGSLVPAQVAENVDTDILTPKAKVDQEDPEVKLYQRLYRLHENNPQYFGIPKKPEKLKDYAIEEIFGE